MPTDKHLVSKLSEDALRSLVNRGTIWICCAGYEDRALAASEIIAGTAGLSFVVVKLNGGDTSNDEAFGKAVQMFKISDMESVFEYEVFACEKAGSELMSYLSARSFDRSSPIVVDISGFPSHGICQMLHALRAIYPVNTVTCVYTSAETYYPTRAEYENACVSGPVFDANNLPQSLTYESSGTLMLSAFNGFSVRQDRACLFLFAGFEKHRAIAAVEGINPRKMVLVYSDPPDPKIGWRLDLSKKLHEDLHSHIDRAEEIIQNTAVCGVLDMLKSYYDMLYDHMNVVLCPMNGKLHTVACYLFWEMYQDVQICFTLPVRYLPSRSSKGVGDRFSCELPQSRGLKLLFGLDDK